MIFFCAEENVATETFIFGSTRKRLVEILKKKTFSHQNIFCLLADLFFSALFHVIHGRWLKHLSTVLLNAKALELSLV